MINWNIRTYTKEDFIESWFSSESIRQVLIKLKLKPVGGNYHTIKKMAEELKLTNDHMLGQAINRGKTKINKSKPIEEYLKKDTHISSYHLKNKLFKAGIFNKECSICENTLWMEKPIPLELDHINGDHYDNRIENLRILCANCHAQTKNYRGKNKKYIRNFKENANECIVCFKNIGRKAKRCKECELELRKINKKLKN